MTPLRCAPWWQMSRATNVRKNEYDNEHHVLLNPEKDDEVVVTAPDDHTCDALLQVKVWRCKLSNLKPQWGAVAPLCDVDEGKCRYMLLECKTINGETLQLVRGYTDESCSTFAEVLEEAVPPLGIAGYTDIRCLGGGYLSFSSHDGAAVLSGASVGFGPANHSAAAAVLKKHYGELAIKIG